MQLMIPATAIRVMSAILLVCCIAIIATQARRGRLYGATLIFQAIGLGLWAVGLALSFVR
jgi:hypothetical protein